MTMIIKWVAFNMGNLKAFPQGESCVFTHKWQLINLFLVGWKRQTIYNTILN